MSDLDVAQHMIVSDSPSFDIVQAMPLDTSRVTEGIVSASEAAPQVLRVDLSAATRLVEITWSSVSGNETIYAQIEASTESEDDDTVALMNSRLLLGAGFGTKTYAVPKSLRRLRVIAQPNDAAPGKTLVQVLEA